MSSISSSALSFALPIPPSASFLLSSEAQHFVQALADQFTSRVEQLLQARVLRQKEWDSGVVPDFLPDTALIRASQWNVGPIPADLQDRRVEITGPVDRKMIINALNSGAKVFMADLEDAHTPTWEGTLQGQVNLYEAVRGTIHYISPEGKHYALADQIATLKVRPRGWHLVEKHVQYQGKPLIGAFWDFGLYIFHNARALLAKGSGPYFYLPKLEHYQEALLWRDIFTFTEDYLGLVRGSIKVTVLIETILAAFQMEEILHSLRNYIVGLNCGRWDYIFSCIKKFHNHPHWVLPDRAQVTMHCHFLKSYYLLLIHTCHKRGAFAMGGMAAHIPIKDDPAAHQAAIAKVEADKEREVKAGHDGTWVAHPGLVPIAQAIFDRYMPTKNQLTKTLPDLHVTSTDLLTVPEGTITEQGVKNNVSVSLRYIESWLRGVGCVPIFHLMEDAATAEISRSQLWQWVRYSARMENGTVITASWIETLIDEECRSLQQAARAEMRYQDAASLLKQLVFSQEFIDFLTVPAMALIS